MIRKIYFCLRAIIIIIITLGVIGAILYYLFGPEHIKQTLSSIAVLGGIYLVLKLGTSPSRLGDIFRSVSMIWIAACIIIGIIGGIVGLIICLFN